MKGGQTQHLAIELLPVDLQVSGAGTRVDERTAVDRGEPDSDRGVLESWWFWTGVGVLVAGGAVTAIALTRDQSAQPGPHVDGRVLVLRVEP